MPFLSQILKDLANEYRMPEDIYLKVWREITEELGYKDAPEPRGPDGQA